MFPPCSPAPRNTHCTQLHTYPQTHPPLTRLFPIQGVAHLQWWNVQFFGRLQAGFKKSDGFLWARATFGSTGYASGNHDAAQTITSRTPLLLLGQQATVMGILHQKFNEEVKVAVTRVQ